MQDSSYPTEVSWRRRGVSLALAIAINLLIVAMLLHLAPPLFRMEKDKSAVSVFQLAADSEERSVKAPVVGPTKRSGGAPKQRPPTEPTPPASGVEKPPEGPPPPLNMILMSRETFAAADISRIPSARSATGAASGSAQGSGTGDASGPDDGAVGTGPGGEKLYNAQWYAEPTNAELSYYLPKGAPRRGVALIACRTVANYRVEDCVELGEEPAGSGLSRAIRQAAWQFRVLPPRVGGRKMVGAWVQIRIDFTEARQP